MTQPLTRKDRRVIASALAAWVFLLGFFVPQYAYAYIDPATTTYLIQIAAAVVITLGVSFSIVLYRFRMVLTRVWVKLTSRARGKNTQEHKNSKDQATPESDGEQKRAQEERRAARKARLQGFILEGSPEPPERASGFTAGAQEGSTAQRSSSVEEHARSTEKKTGKTGSVAAKNKGKTSFREKFALLRSDERSFKQRLALSALVSASLIFTVLIFGPLELFASSRSDMLFNLSDFAGALLLVALVCFVILTGLLLLLKGRLLDNALCILVGLLLASYIQATFFNGFIGQLNGDPIIWHEHQTEALFNLVLWIAVVAVFFGLRYFNRRVWQGATIFVSSVLIVVQLVALVSISDNLTSEPDPGERSLVLTNEGLLELSSEKNVVVFLLDKFDQTYIDDLLAKDPSFFDGLEGFTRYSDNLTRYSYTYPSIAYSLTGLVNDYTIPSNEYLPEAYGQHLFIDDLVDAGWTSNLYLSAGYDYQSKKLLEGRADNLLNVDDLMGERSSLDEFITSLKLVEKLDQLSAFRYAPTGLKSIFWMSSADVSEVIVEARQEYNSGYQGEFMDELRQTGLAATDENPLFVYYHLDGSHKPHYLDSDGYRVPRGETDAITQTEGCFKIIFEYISQLKELGLYDDTCIIITGDHGVKGETLAGLFYKPMGPSSGEPLSESSAPVSDDNLVPTIVEQAGITSTAVAAEGLTYAEVTPENTPRRTVVQHYRNEHSVFVLSIYEVEGRAKDMNNWQLMHKEESGLDYWMKPK